MKQEIQASELRLGNYVNTPREDQNPFRIDLIEHLSADFCKVGMDVYKYKTPFGMMDGHPLTWYLKDLSPIPLTEEWICKFSKTNYEFEKTSTGRFDIHISGTYITTLEFVHQYQNLHYALTGKELTTNKELINS